VAWLLAATWLLAILTVLTMTYVRREREARQIELRAETAQFQRAEQAAAILLAACDRIVVGRSNQFAVKP
jgi:hypothetical protein